MRPQEQTSQLKLWRERFPRPWPDNAVDHEAAGRLEVFDGLFCLGPEDAINADVQASLDAAHVLAFGASLQGLARIVAGPAATEDRSERRESHRTGGVPRQFHITCPQTKVRGGW